MIDYKLAASKNDSDMLSECINKDYDSVEYLYNNGRVSQSVFESYNWLWRNSSIRISNHLEQYEGAPIPDDCYNLVYPYLDKVLVVFFK